MVTIPNRVRVVAVLSALALAGGLLTLALLAKPAQAQTRGAVSEQFPFALTLDASACTGELVEVTGTLHTVNHFRVQPDGTYHAISHLNLAGMKGVGQTTGEEYVIPASSVAVEHFTESGQIISGTVDINLVIGKGKIPNQEAFALVHYVISPEGEFKMETIQFHVKCHQEPEGEAGGGA